MPTCSTCSWDCSGRVWEGIQSWDSRPFWGYLGWRTYHIPLLFWDTSAWGLGTVFYLFCIFSPTWEVGPTAPPACISYGDSGWGLPPLPAPTCFRPFPALITDSATCISPPPLEFYRFCSCISHFGRRFLQGLPPACWVVLGPGAGPATTACRCFFVLPGSCLGSGLGGHLVMPLLLPAFLPLPAAVLGRCILRLPDYHRLYHFHSLESVRWSGDFHHRILVMDSLEGLRSTECHLPIPFLHATVLTDLPAPACRGTTSHRFIDWEGLPLDCTPAIRCEQPSGAIRLRCLPACLPADLGGTCTRLGYHLHLRYRHLQATCHLFVLFAGVCVPPQWVCTCRDTVGTWADGGHLHFSVTTILRDNRRLEISLGTPADTRWVPTTVTPPPPGTVTCRSATCHFLACLLVPDATVLPAARALLPAALPAWIPFCSTCRTSARTDAWCVRFWVHHLCRCLFGEDTWVVTWSGSLPCHLQMPPAGCLIPACLCLGLPP